MMNNPDVVNCTYIHPTKGHGTKKMSVKKLKKMAQKKGIIIVDEDGSPLKTDEDFESLSDKAKKWNVEETEKTTKITIITPVKGG